MYAEYNRQTDKEHPATRLRRWGWVAAMVLVAAILLTFLLTALSSSLPQARAVGPTYVSGDITGVVTWTRSSSPYIVQDPGVSVDTGGVLVIEPGVEVRFEAGTALDVWGELTAVGAMTRPITFTSDLAPPQPGDWWGISFGYEGVGQLTWCDLGYAGAGAMTAEDGALTIQSPDVTVSHCRIHDNKGSGVSAWSSAALQLSNVSIEDNSSHGVAIDGGVLNPTLEDVTIANNQGAAVQQGADVMIPTYRSITATGNLTDAVVIQGGELSQGAYWDFAQAGIPVQIADYVYLPSERDLIVQPGTALYFQPGGSLDVWGGNLYALGIAESPITFTGVISQPGSWEGIGGEGGRILLDHCDLSFGGADNRPLLDVRDDSTIQNSRIHHSAGIGIRASGQPVIVYNQIYSNTEYGLESTNTITPVDARFNWWGHPSGPYHPDQNPGGQGDEVSDNVQFSPWLTDTTKGEDLQGAYLAVSLAGPDYVHPGEVVEYATFYNNITTRTITSPLVLMLPTYVQYIDHTGDGVYWPRNHEVFWDDDLAPGESMVESVRVRYLWGLEDETSHLALSYPADIITPLLEAHLNYTPTGAITEVALSQAAFEAQCATQQELNQLYGQFLDEGRVFASASRQTFRGGDVITQATLLAPDRSAVTFLQYDGESVSSIRMDPTKITIQDAGGGSVYDPDLMDWTHFGGWISETAASQVRPAAPHSVGRYAACWTNCAGGKIAGLVASAVKLKAISAVLSAADCFGCIGGDASDCASCAAALKGVPGVGEVIDVAGLVWCSEKCKEPEGCQHDEVYCQNKIAYHWECNEWTGELKGGKVEDCIKNVLKPGQYVCQSDRGCVDLEKEIPDWKDCLASRSRVQYVYSGISSAHDPNAKYGAEGDLLPGQRVTYTIAYENEGAGAAYGVYILDTLSEHFDPATLRIVGDGRYISATRTLLWTIGEVGSSGHVTATGAVTFSVRLKPDLPGGAVVVNQAVVHFPSVPEETPTNSVINVIQPVTALPQTVHTGAMQPVSITLQGHDVGGAPLTYTIAADPSYGRLTGDPPIVSYHPMTNFTGLDHFSFQASNGVTESRPAEISIIVEPSASDTIPPQVRWTEPVSGAMDVWASSAPVYSTHDGEPVYAPIITIGFSEAMSGTTVTSQTVQLLDSQGRPVPATVAYDGMSHQTRLVPSGPLPGSGAYSGRVSTSVKDASGNTMADEYVWHFQVEMEEMQRLYLPLVMRNLP